LTATKVKMICEHDHPKSCNVVEKSFRDPLSSTGDTQTTPRLAVQEQGRRHCSCSRRNYLRLNTSGIASPRDLKREAAVSADLKPTVTTRNAFRLGIVSGAAPEKAAAFANTSIATRHSMRISDNAFNSFMNVRTQTPNTHTQQFSHLKGDALYNAVKGLPRWVNSPLGSVPRMSLLPGFAIYVVSLLTTDI
jgi:hypothetical protein